jgi:hypothetical protein
METLFVMGGNEMSELNSRVNGSQLLKQGKLLSPSALSEWKSQMLPCIDGCKKIACNAVKQIFTLS